jgi:hypothetical protein
MIGDDAFYWENPQNGIEAQFSKDHVLDVAIVFGGSTAKSFEDLSDEEVDDAVRFITDNR